MYQLEQFGISGKLLGGGEGGSGLLVAKCVNAGVPQEVYVGSVAFLNLF